MADLTGPEPAKRNSHPRQLWLLWLLAPLFVVLAVVGFLLIYPIIPRSVDQKRAEAKVALEQLGCTVESLGAEVTVNCPATFTDDQLKKLPPLTGAYDTVLLILKGTKVTVDGAADLKPLTNLKLLDLTGLSLTDGSLVNLEGMSQLQHLHLTKTGIGDEGLAHLKPLAALQRLFLEDNPGVTSKGLVHLTKLPELWDLRLDRTKVDDQGLVTLSEMTQLRQLWLRDLPDVTPGGIGNLKQSLPELKVKR